MKVKIRFADGSAQFVEIKGPPSFESWEKSFDVFVSAMLHNDAWTVAGAQVYRMKIKEMAALVGSKGWPELYWQEVRIREEVLPRMIQELKHIKDTGGTLPGIMSETGLVRPVHFDESRPYIAAFELLTGNDRWWDVNIIRPWQAEVQAENAGAKKPPAAAEGLKDFMKERGISGEILVVAGEPTTKAPKPSEASSATSTAPITRNSGPEAYKARQATAAALGVSNRFVKNMMRQAYSKGQALKGAAVKGPGKASKGNSKGNKGWWSNSWQGKNSWRPKGWNKGAKGGGKGTCHDLNNGNSPCADKPDEPCPRGFRHVCSLCGQSGHGAYNCTNQE